MTKSDPVALIFLVDDMCEASRLYWGGKALDGTRQEFSINNSLLKPALLVTNFLEAMYYNKNIILVMS